MRINTVQVHTIDQLLFEDQIEIVTAARVYIKVPFRHQGRTKNYMDCVGLIIQVAKDVERCTQDFKYNNYRRLPDVKRMQAALREHMYQISVKDSTVGDIVYMLNVGTNVPQHVAIRTDLGMIHAYEEAGMVVEHGMRDKWSEPHIVEAYRYKEKNWWLN